MGASFETCPAGPSCGAAHVWVRSSGAWSEQAQLTASDRAAGAELGTSVALSSDGSIALVGALRADCPAGDSCGAAYVFVRYGQSWSDAQRLSAAEVGAGNFFGTSVAPLSGDGSVALVGASLGFAGRAFAETPTSSRAPVGLARDGRI